MSLRSRWIATCVLLSISEMLLPSGLHAQERDFGFGIPGRVVSAVEDSSGDCISLRIRGKQPLPVPVIQYFPGTAGQTVMCVDFPELVWNQPSSIIHPHNRLVESVRIGQFQTSPPIFRISITTSNPAMLRKIDLHAEGDVLIVRFPRLEERNKVDVAETVNAKSPQPASRNVMRNSDQGETSSRNIAGRYIPLPAPKQSNSILQSLDAEIARRSDKKLSDKKEPPPLSRLPVLRPAIPVPGGGVARDAVLERVPPLVKVAEKPVEKKVAPPAPNGVRATPGSVDVPLAPAGEPVTQAEDAPGEKRSRNPFSRLSSVFPPLAPAFRRRHSTAAELSEPSEEKPLKPLTTKKSESPLPQLNSKKSETPIRTDASDRGLPPRAPDFQQFSTPASPKPGETRGGEKGVAKIPPAAPDRKLARVEPIDDCQPVVEPFANVSPSISFAGTQPLQLIVRGAGPMRYRSFRLSEPERYVVDFIDGAPSLDMNIPESPAPAVLSAVRSGMPDGDSSVRIVLDLAKAGVAVKEELSADRTSMALTLTESSFPAAANFSASTGTCTVVLDAGHGGSDPGAQRGDLREKDMTLGITCKLKKNLEARGMRVIMTRSDDTFVSLEERVRITNSVKPDAFVSVHINSLESDSGIRGIETYYQNDCSRLLAQKIHGALVGHLAVPDRNVRKARFYVVNHTPHPAILAEVGFISNKQEREKLMSSDYQGKVAEALGQGIIFYLSESRNLARKGQDERKSVDLPSAAPTRSESASVIPHIFTR
ncbi:MAG: N-acetylmuramoyl-L-alanine amidase [Candidatus Obscuribacterales bacterium]|nr:N-acetylmuramoyl-L-alanine amidase [Candidatus Obscuribacterales bacterium]